MEKNIIKIYLDNCCFNRPFDSQSQLRVKLETEAKLKIQEYITLNKFQLIWSYILDYENSKNPFLERKEQIGKWHKYSIVDIKANQSIIDKAVNFNNFGLKKFDSLHIACAVEAKAKYFITTDDGILIKSDIVKETIIIDPISFIKELTL